MHTNTKGQALIAWPLDCNSAKLCFEKVSMHLLQLLRSNLSGCGLRIFVF